jgi:hypothetical protein
MASAPSASFVIRPRSQDLVPASLADVPAVSGEIVYAATAEQRPYYYMYEPPPGTPRLVGEYRPIRLPVHDARGITRLLSLDLQGFSFHEHESALGNAYDDAEVRAVYYPEMERLVARHTGAERVLVFDHNLRSGPKAKAGQNGVYEPVRRAHNDYTVESAELRLRQLLGDEEAERRQRRRFVFINVWRPLFGPVRDTPLAMCDARTLDPKDLVPIDLLYRDRVGQNYTFLHAPEHRWFYVSGMQAHEVLLLKCFDSMTDGRARFTAHTAFDDPTAPLDSRPRESIEIRTIAFY